MRARACAVPIHFGPVRAPSLRPKGWARRPRQSQRDIALASCEEWVSRGRWEAGCHRRIRGEFDPPQIGSQSGCSRILASISASSESISS
eukprot:79800-Pleurochrysis_carterae.AAC.4